MAFASHDKAKGQKTQSEEPAFGAEFETDTSVVQNNFTTFNVNPDVHIFTSVLFF
jgi:hypothetical protein